MTEQGDMLRELSEDDRSLLRTLAWFTNRTVGEIVASVVREYIHGAGRKELVAAVTSSGQSEMRGLLDAIGYLPSDELKQNVLSQVGVTYEDLRTQGRKRAFRE